MKLYNIDNAGKIRVWEIRVLDFNICIEHGLLNGERQQQIERIDRGKAGRNIQEQIDSRVNSRISKQKAKGYRETIDEAKKYRGCNELNLHKPMLAQRYDKVKNVNFKNAVIQRKLDGNRMLVTRQNGDLLAYSRGGKEILTLDHILSDLENLEEGQTVDGEIYIHGLPLKDINSRIKRKQDATKELKYHIYDVVEDKPFRERFMLPEVGDSIICEPCWDYNSADVSRLFKVVRSEGYEGLIIRTDNVGYEAGKRSKSLIKMKERNDAEFKVIDVEVAKDDTGILVLEMPNGKTFKAVAPGDRLDKINVAMHPEKYVNRIVTVSYAYITDYGIPFHAVAERYRDDV